MLKQLASLEPFFFFSSEEQKRSHHGKKRNRFSVGNGVLVNNICGNAASIFFLRAGNTVHCTLCCLVAPVTLHLKPTKMRERLGAFSQIPHRSQVFQFF